MGSTSRSSVANGIGHERPSLESWGRGAGRVIRIRARSKDDWRRLKETGCTTGGRPGTGSSSRDSATRWSTSRLLERARMEAREEAGDGSEGTLGSLFGVSDARGHNGLGFADPKCDPSGVVIFKAFLHGKKEDIMISN
jgi:hypothetical protein